MMSRVWRTGLACALTDGLWATVQTFARGQPPLSVWMRVAATVFGPGMLTAGPAAVVVGLGVHVCVAFGASAVFLVLLSRSAGLRRLVSRPAGLVCAAAVYGPLVWLTMSALVIPLRTGRPLAVTGRWFTELAGHVVFVGLPIVWAARREDGRAAPASRSVG
ncbi:MAG: hypothetical protein U0Q12_15450 [Vicinamibacterales bacterium]